MGADEMRQIARWILAVLAAPEDEAVLAATKSEVVAMADQFAVPAARLEQSLEAVER
jgi:glycine/serine hydroxymethyltransferase